MKMLRRSVLLVGVAAMAVGIFLAWYVYGGWPAPNGYSFPRHSTFGGPDALFIGTLEDVDGCIRASGHGSFAVVWPPGYLLSAERGEPVIHGSGEEVPMGERVTMGGGYYEDGSPPPGTRDLGSCAPPFFLSTGFTE